MNREDAQHQPSTDEPTISAQPKDKAELADRAADAATQLYVNNEHAERKRRFDVALARATGSQVAP